MLGISLDGPLHGIMSRSPKEQSIHRTPPIPCPTCHHQRYSSGRHQLHQVGAVEQWAVAPQAFASPTNKAEAQARRKLSAKCTDPARIARFNRNTATAEDPKGPKAQNARRKKKAALPGSLAGNSRACGRDDVVVAFFPFPHQIPGWRLDNRSLFTTEHSLASCHHYYSAAVLSPSIVRDMVE
nr:hypothetical protein CFP56_43898 [Quercus suber]